MRRLFVGNFDFEHQLAGNSSRTAASVVTGLAAAWLALAQADDAILAPVAYGSADLEQLRELRGELPRWVQSAEEFPEGEVVPWGWTPDVAALMNGGTANLRPDFDVVRTVNNRIFRLALEQEWNVALPGSQELRNMAEAAEAVRRLGSDDNAWVIKSAYGMSGRERMCGRGPVLAETQGMWLRRRLREVGPAVIEPWLECLEEAGIQIDVPPQGSPVLLGLTQLLVGRGGVYRGSRFSSDGVPVSDAVDDRFWQPAVDVALRVGERLQSLGYFGALGIDAMRYRQPDGEVSLRPLQDLNARFTMGRLSLGWRSLLQADECATWLHFPWSPIVAGDLSAHLPGWLAGLSSIPDGCRFVCTTPRPTGSSADGHDHRSALLIAPDSTARQFAEAIFWEALANHLRPARN